MQNREICQRELAAQNTVVESLPTQVSVETTSICNLRCVMCGHAIGDVKRLKHMPNDQIESLRPALTVADSVQLHGIGEPTASPSFWKIMESGYINPDADVNVNSNFTLLNDKKIDTLVNSHLKLSLNVSTDAARPDTYAKIRGADLQVVLDNIRKVISRRNGKYPEIFMNMTLMRQNIEEVVEFVELAHELGVDRVFLWHLNHWDDATMAKYKIDRDGWRFDYAEQGLWNHPDLSDRYIKMAVKRASELKMPLYLDQNKVVFFNTDETDEATDDMEVPSSDVSVKDCAYPWRWALVTSSGAVRPCCYATKDVGDINTDSIVDIWNNKTMQALRASVRANRVHPVCEGASCKFVQQMPKQSWLGRLGSRAREVLGV
jgi:MoaA/NifB/PqqE/SkfB family radical SAM enzyme